LPNWLDAYLEYTQWNESPERFHLWTGVSTIAGALRRRVFIDMGYFRWYPNFFIFFVAPPGVVSKSTTANIGMELLKKLDYIKFGPSAVTWQRLVKSLADSREDVCIGGTGVNAEYEPMCALTIVASELGTFFDPNNREMVDVLVDLWDGKQGDWKKETLHSGDFSIQNPWINIIGCTTPGWIADNCSEYFVSGGFASRVLFVYGKEKRKFVAYPKELIDEGKFAPLRRDLIHDLECISTFQGEYRLTPGALKWGTEWYEQHHRNPPPHMSNNQFGGYLARKQTLVHKTAMIIAASYKDHLVIDEHDLSKAVGMVSDLEGDMGMVFAQMFKEKDTAHAEIVHNFLKVSGRISKADLFYNVMNRLTKPSFDNALGALIDAGIVSVEQEGNTIMVSLRTQTHRLKLIQ
jgi:hypothetical protein